MVGRSTVGVIGDVNDCDQRGSVTVELGTAIEEYERCIGLRVSRGAGRDRRGNELDLN